MGGLGGIREGAGWGSGGGGPRAARPLRRWAAHGPARWPLPREETDQRTRGYRNRGFFRFEQVADAAGGAKGEGFVGQRVVQAAGLAAFGVAVEGGQGDPVAR